MDVDSSVSLTPSVTYMATGNLGIELLAAWPYSHDIELKGAGQIAETKHLPPTLSAQWHFNPIGRFQPYVGLGVNWTIFFDEDVEPLLTSARSIRWVLSFTADFNVNENWLVNLDVRWIDIESDLEATFDDGSSADIGKVEIDPWLFGLNVGYKF